jgi:beta-mannosidase
MSESLVTPGAGIRIHQLDGWTVSAVSGPVPEGVGAAPFAASVPGYVHTDLFRAGLIADPFDGANEEDQQWIGDTQWRYETGFTWSDDGAHRHDLVAEGLDTLATIELNGVVVGRTENQHRSYRIDLRGALAEGENRLRITFDAPVPAAVRRAEEHGLLPHVNHHPYNTLRKMAANFGWDWGIDVATSGIWKPIRIESWSGVRIASVRPLVDVEGSTGILSAHVELEWEEPRHVARATAESAGSRAEAVEEALVVVRVADREERVSVPAGQRSALAVVEVPDVALWWPLGHGEQPLYDVDVDVSLSEDSAPRSDRSDTWHGRIGFRTVTLDTAADEEGAPFVVRVNGEPVVVRGANWIPDHAFVTEIDSARYARRVTDAVEANVNLLRVWGGGIYESGDFYSECDRRGVLVWQDFLFACAAYAEESWLGDEVVAEAREAITRLSSHPSLVVWNGCNENIWGYVDWGWRPKIGDRTWGNGYYRDLLPTLISELDPTRPYSPGSPYSFSEYIHPNDPANGTMHIWDVWNQRDYTVYRDYAPRFVSEFGFQGPPAWSTLTRVVHDEPLDPYGRQMLVHQKAQDGNLKLERGLGSHLPLPSTIEDWHWATQLNQANAVRFGIEHFRSLTPHNMGTIVWQLNDNWPVVSWAAVDFDEHRKPLWYALREAYRPRLATIQPRDGGLALILANDHAGSWLGSALVQRIAFSGQVHAEFAVDVEVGARGAATVPLPAEAISFEDARSELIAVRFPEDSGFATAVWNPVEGVEQRLSGDAFEAGASRTDDGYLIVVQATQYTRDVFLQVDRVDPAARIDEGLVTLLPGQSAEFHVHSTVDVDPSAFAVRPVLRTLNDLVAG